VATAYAECSPLIVMSGMDDSRHLGKGAKQELPQVEMCAPITKWSALLSDGRLIPEYVARAFRAATSGVAGPVHLSLTVDALEQAVDASGLSAVEDESPASAGRGREVGFAERAVALLSGAERPVIVAGTMAFWSGAGEALRSLVEATRIPLFTVERARGLVPDDHPCCFGDGYSSVNPAAQMIHHSDAVLLLGEKIDCRFGYGSSFGQAKVVHVYPDPAEIGRNRHADLSAACDIPAAVTALLERARRVKWREKRKWVDTLQEARREHAAQVAKLAAADSSPIHPLRIATEVERWAGGGDIWVFDGGDFSGWSRFALSARRPGGWQAGTVLGHLGTGLPYALGAKLASPESRVVLLTGDGSLGFSAAEFETAARHRIPVVVVVGNDGAWGIERYFQGKRYGADRLVGTELSRVRWDRTAESLGAWGEHVETAAELRPALERAAASGKAACVDVRMQSVPSPLARSFARVFARRRGRSMGTEH
jgi:acetolactate synthase-1/2/3 large subunit